MLLAMTAAPISSAAASPRHRTHHSHGIDVSHYQGSIAWAKLPRQGVDFAYIKATEGADRVDARFSTNWRAAHAAGIRRGAYHFFTLCRSGREQAAHFVRHVPTEAAALPPAVDLETPSNCHRSVSRAQLHKELSDFLRIVEAHYQKRAVLYLTRRFDRHYQVSANFEQPLWLRGIRSEPHFAARHWTIWQSSSVHKLEGVHGRVDWNVARNPA
jgi:lysozyme